MTASHRPTVRHRRVFFIPGFDPHPPRRYRELYRREGRRQASIGGYRIAQDRPRDGSADWVVTAEIGGARCEAAFEVLEWADLVRDTMTGGVAASYVALVRTAWIYLSTGALWRLSWLRRGPVLAALYPVAVLIAQAALATLAGWGAGTVVAGVSLPLFGWVAGLALVGAVLRAFLRHDDRLFAHYLMRDYAYTAGHRGAYDPALEARIADWSRRIGAALETDVDEVLVVGHSSGAHLAVSALAGVPRRERAGGAGPHLALLTLGQAIPMVSFLPEAKRLRTDLRSLSEDPAITWVDVSAPGDPGSFALCDPVAVSGVATANSRWPLVISAAFSQTLTPKAWAAMRWRYFRRHIQYLCAFDRPAGYDYFQITAGPETLRDRFAGRRASTQRIDVPASAFTSVAA